MNTRKTLFVLSITLLGLVPALAQKNAPAIDAPQTKDHPGLPRYEGSTILLQSEQEYGEHGLQIAGLSAPNSSDPAEVRVVEGRLHRTTYLFLNPEAKKRSTLEIARNYEMALKDAGFQTIWAGGEAEIRNGPPRKYYSGEDVDRQLLTTGISDRRYFCMEKSGLYAAILVVNRKWEHVMNSGNASPANRFGEKITIPEGAILIQVDIVNTRPMEEKMIVVSAAEMEKTISASGKIALYGILFDFNKADVKPESAPTLEQMAKLLRDEPELKVLIVGHTDNVGTFEFNKDLSERRARAVASALAKDYGIATDRMTPLGASFMAPVSTNTTEEGRALNRRVELVAR